MKDPWRSLEFNKRLPGDIPTICLHGDRDEVGRPVCMSMERERQGEREEREEAREGERKERERDVLGHSND